VEAGKLRHRVLIESPTTAASAYGQGEPTWSTLDTVWAFVRPVRAGEMIRAGQPGMETTYIIQIRYRADIRADMRLTWEGNVLFPTSIIDVNGRHEELEIIAHEREAASG
jgi:SPP1 family predicted phage head-tail adaptor